MILYLTSDPGGIRLSEEGPISTPLKEHNSFRKHLMNDLLTHNLHESPNSFDNYVHMRCLIFASDPDIFEENDANLKMFENSFIASGIAVDEIALCDHRHMEYADLISNYNFILLCGGHLPTENRFFGELNLAPKLKDFDGIVMGISAGTMNCATTTYCPPEMPGEALDANFMCELKGLGYVNYKIIPHFQCLRTFQPDGLSLLNDFLLPDSYTHELIALNDGSYIRVTDAATVKAKAYLYGESYTIKNGAITPLCMDNQRCLLSN